MSNVLLQVNQRQFLKKYDEAFFQMLINTYNEALFQSITTNDPKWYEVQK